MTPAHALVRPFFPAILSLPLLLATAPGCTRSSGDGGPAASGNDAPEVTAIHQGTWRDPADGHEIRLIDTPLAACFGFKGYSLKTPQGSTTATMEGARTCHITLASAKKEEYHFAVFTDEVMVPFMAMTRQKLENVLSRPLDEPDAFLYEVKGKLGQKEITGWYGKKVGPHAVRCNALQWRDSQVLSFSFQRAVLELCRTLSYTAPR